MIVSLEWLKDYLDLSDQTPESVSYLLTMLGHEVESVEYPDDFTGVAVGKILSCEPIPRSKNKKCLVDISKEKLTIVCGAPNVRAGILVPVVVPGGSLPGGHKIETTVIAGETSQGMICSSAELNLGTDHSGIWILEEEFPQPGFFEIGADLHRYFPPDAVFNLEITHNRGDCLGHIGMARELAAGLNRELKYPKFLLREDEKPASSIASVKILDAERCPRYGARLVLDAQIKPSPRWMQRRLQAIGLRPISNVVDVTNYVMMEYGHPLHAFDLRMLAERRIVVKTAASGEKFTTLDGKEHELTDEDLLICDGKKGVAVAGVMGGLNSEIAEDTKDILLECACFHPISIRKTSKRLGIVTDSSYRFERGVDAKGVPRVVDRTAYLVQATAGGRVLKGIVDDYPLKTASSVIELHPERVNFILGGNISQTVMVDCLQRLEMNITELADTILVTPPTFRPDLQKEIDLIEEIARIDGYDKIECASHSLVSLEVQPLDKEELDAALRSALTAEGLQEALTHSMRHPQRTGLGSEIPVALRNPISADFAVLRTDLLAPLLETVALNLHYGAETVRIFELGNVFCRSGSGVVESKQIAGLLTGLAEETHWSGKAGEYDLFTLKGLVENFLSYISLDNYRIYSYFNCGSFTEASAVKIGDEEIGLFGSIAPAILEKYDINQPVYFFTFDYELLRRHRRTDKKYHEFSRFPAVKRDLSLIFPEDIAAGQIEQKVRAKSGEYLRGIEFFDLYRGGQLPAGKKSLSFALRFQSDQCTLTDEEVDACIEAIVKGLESLGGQLRRI